jgi:hypothetical protein
MDLLCHGLKSIFLGQLNHKPLWGVLETGVSSRFPPATPPKQPENTAQEKWYTIPLQTVQNLHQSIPRGTVVYRQQQLPKHLHLDNVLAEVKFY